MIGRGSRWNGGIDGGTELPVTATFMFFNENDLKFVCFLRKIYYFARRLADDINKSTRHTSDCWHVGPFVLFGQVGVQSVGWQSLLDCRRNQDGAILNFAFPDWLALYLFMSSQLFRLPHIIVPQKVRP